MEVYCREVLTLHVKSQGSTVKADPETSEVRTVNLTATVQCSSDRPHMHSDVCLNHFGFSALPPSCTSPLSGAHHSQRGR